MNNKILKYLLFLFLAVPGLLSAKDPTPFHQNSWSLQSGVFYVDHPGGDFNFKCTATRPAYKITGKTRAANVPAILVTIYTPDEHVYKDFYWHDDKDQKQNEFGDDCN